MAAIKLTVLWCPLGSVGTPVAPVAVAFSFIFAAHLSDIYCVWLKALESEGLYVSGSVPKRYLKDIKHLSFSDFDGALHWNKQP